MLTSELINSIKLKGSNPNFLDSEILDFAYTEVTDRILPILKAQNNGYNLVTEDINIVAGKNKYYVPRRSYGGTVNELKIVRTDTLYNIEYINPELIKSTTSGSPSKFYFQGDNIVLYPTPNTNEVLRVWYEITPSKLVTRDMCGVITNISDNTITLDIVPIEFGSVNIFDIISRYGLHDLKLRSSQGTIAGNDITFTSLPSEVNVGDYLALENETCLIQIPNNYLNLLTQYTLDSIFMSIGDFEAAARHLNSAQSILERLEKSTNPRISGEQKLFNNPW